jgi:hypothetical protein
MRKTLSTRGMTLLEVTLAAFLFALIIGICFGVTIASVRSFDESIAVAYIQTKGEKALKIMTEEIGDATALEPASVNANGTTLHGAQINYRVPIRYGNPTLVKPGENLELVQPAGLPVLRQAISNPTMPGDFSLALDFGWRDDRINVLNLDGGASVALEGPGLKASPAPDGVTLVNGLTPEGHMSFRFVQNENAYLGENGVFDEAAENIDIDNDGAKNRRYIVGYLERCIFLNNDRVGTGVSGAESLLNNSRVQMADSNILQPADSSPTGDPNQLQTNRIFVKVGSRVDVNFYIASVSPQGLIRMVRCSTSIFLRNNSN